MTNNKSNLKRSKFFFFLTLAYLILAGLIRFTVPEQPETLIMVYVCIGMSPLTALMGIHCWMKAKKLEKKDREEEIKKYKPIG